VWERDTKKETWVSVVSWCWFLLCLCPQQMPEMYPAMLLSRIRTTSSRMVPLLVTRELGAMGNGVGGGGVGCSVGGGSGGTHP